jgi:hypothetical protein
MVQGRAARCAGLLSCARGRHVVSESPEALPGGKLYPTVRTAGCATARPGLDLLELTYPFSQVGLLSPTEFARLATERRSRADRSLPPVNEQTLQELHRGGVLVPLFRVDLEPRPDAPGIDISDSLTVRHVQTAFINELLRGAAEGRVSDPAAIGFESWPTERRRTQWPSVETGYLYSRHQLLGLDAVRSFVASLKARVHDRKVTWHLEDAALPNAPTLEAIVSWRQLAITLSALDTYYWPQITHQLSHDLDAWQQALHAFDREQALVWLGLTLDQIERAVMDLRLSASSCDDMGEFYDLIRRASANAWKSLRGDAAVALDLRLAADILTRFAEDLNPGGDYAGAQYAPLSQEGLSARPESLDAVLTHLRVSPFPALVIGLEGATEYKLVPRVLATLGIQWDHNRIRIVDGGGTGSNLSLLARYAVEPLLGRDLGDHVVLDRPQTRFLIMTDAENKYRTPADRRYQRKLLLDSLTKNVPPDLRPNYYINTRRGRIVDIVTWGKLPFEFAHFTDRELANAMLEIAKMPHPQGRARLVQNLRLQRLHDPEPNVEKVFWRGSGLKKVPLAEALWPVLERKISAAIGRGASGPPVMRACIRAYEMMAVSENVPIALRRRRPRS